MIKKIFVLFALVFGLSISLLAENKIRGIKSYGFIDLEGAKLSAIIVEYDKPVNANWVKRQKYVIDNYTTLQVKNKGYENAIELDGDSIKGNEGTSTSIYVSNKPEPGDKKLKRGKYVIIEVNTKYMLKTQNLVYTDAMIASVNGISNFKETQEISSRGKVKTVYNTDVNTIILPEFGKGSGWTLHYVGKNAFHAKRGYSEYTGKYSDFEVPYAIYVPDAQILEKHKGNVSLAIHMEHAGGNGQDPMLGVTSSRAPVILVSDAIQKENPCIVVVPQVDDKVRSTDDLVASSEMNTAAWEMIDSLLAKYKGYINEDRIYGTGQSMGGMLLLDMSAQRDNFFAGLALVGAQWSNNYNKDFQHNGSPARTPDNDSISFNGFGLDRDNYQNWYYMISDDNIHVFTCKDDVMATGEWQATKDYFATAGKKMAYSEWSPYEKLDEQIKKDQTLLSIPAESPGSGIYWGVFSTGSHMSTWKYGYRLITPIQWLFKQNRQTAVKRGKLELLKNKWLGRDTEGNVIPGSGTNGLNSAQFTPHGRSDIYVEGWTPENIKK
jgi:peptidase-like protein